MELLKFSSVILLNLLPLVGMLFFHWSPINAIIFYWLEFIGLTVRTLWMPKEPGMVNLFRQGWSFPAFILIFWGLIEISTMAGFVEVTSKACVHSGLSVSCTETLGKVNWGVVLSYLDKSWPALLLALFRPIRVRKNSSPQTLTQLYIWLSFPSTTYFISWIGLTVLLISSSIITFNNYSPLIPALVIVSFKGMLDTYYWLNENKGVVV